MAASRTYGVLDVALALVHGLIGFAVAPSRSMAFNLIFAVVIALELSAGVALLLDVRGSRRLALVQSLVMLAFSATVIVLLVASAAYLRGVYGALGQGMAVLALVAAALVIELMALVPLFQLRFLLRER